MVSSKGNIFLPSGLVFGGGGGWGIFLFFGVRYYVLGDGNCIQTRIRVRSKGTVFSAMEVSILGVGSFFFFWGRGLVFCLGDDDCT